MPRVLPFHGIRFDWRRVRLGRVLCPPYDVIPERMARRLRAVPHNSIHLELPQGGEGRYRAAAKTWAKWRKEGILIHDLIPAYYVVEQRFKLDGKEYRRTGFLSSLRLDDDGVRQVTPHEKTFSKPKQDRWNLLDALKAQVSPIFALYEDPGGKIRKVLSVIMRRPPAAEGLAPDGVFVRIWRAAESEAHREIEKAFMAKRLLIADGHHRLEVSKRYGCKGVLCYLCAEEDPGLRVLPTHRVLSQPEQAFGSLKKTCTLRAYGSLDALEKAIEKQRSSFAFGVIVKRPKGNLPGRFTLAVPLASSERGIRSGLGVEWLSKTLFSPADQGHIFYTHDSREAAKMAGASGAAFLVKPVEVGAIRRAVKRIGLLPQKSTYFFPKVEAGIVFQEIR